MNDLVADFDDLLKDSKKAGLRHNWLDLEKKFAAYTTKGPAIVRVKALFYSAKCYHELAQRSFSNADFLAAAQRYEKTGITYSKNALAAESLFLAADIYADKANNNKKALKLLDRLLANYPKSDFAPRAQSLKEKISTSGSQLSSAAERNDKTDKQNDSRSSSIAEQLGLTVKTIMIDAGHGGKDPGAEGNGITEQLLTMDMAEIVGDKLRKKGFKVIYTRNKNTFIPLGDRTSKANDNRADVFLSIHANANNDASIRGLETYYLDMANTKSAARVAARENGVSEDKLSDVQLILSDLMLNSKVSESRQLARMVHKGILASVRQGKFTLPDHGVRPAPFYVLMGARMPSILVEMGYVTNDSDAKLLKSKDFLNRQADGIVDGLVNFREYIAKELK